MGSDGSAAEFCFEESRSGSDHQSPGHFFLDRDAEFDPDAKRLQDLLNRKMPEIRRLLRRLLRNDSDLPEYMDRIYRRLQATRHSDAYLDETSIWRCAISIVHEDRRRAWRRFVSTDVTQMNNADPESLAFVTELVRRDQLRAFRDCLDEWTRQVFDLKYSSPVQQSAKEMAKRLGITRDAFYQRWKRGMDAGREEYRRRHGDPMQ